ncbi:MAG TPA: hypothetical protein VJB70_01900 [Candidatus Paceibacterota bacterium]
MRQIEIVIFIVIIGLFLTYAYSRTENLIRGPHILIETPRDGITSRQSLVTVSGTAKNTNTLFLNDRQIFTDQKGTIREELLLSYGYNIFAFRATDKFGREVVKTIQLVYK